MAIKSTRSIPVADEHTLALILPSTFVALEQAVESAQEFLAARDIDEELAYTVVLLVSEAVTNAMKHGNRWQPEKSITMTVTAKENVVEVTVTDEGEGFDLSQAPKPLEDQNLLKGGGRGLFLIRTLADEVCYEQGGRCVWLAVRAKGASRGSDAV